MEGREGARATHSAQAACQDAAMDYVAAVAALEHNDADGLLSACKGCSPGMLNTKVINGKLGNAPVYKPLDWVDGDTMLHLAMRNKRWHCRRVLVSDLGADAMTGNSNGHTVRSNPLWLLLLCNRLCCSGLSISLP